MNKADDCRFTVADDAEITKTQANAAPILL